MPPSAPGRPPDRAPPRSYSSDFAAAFFRLFSRLRFVFILSTRAFSASSFARLAAFASSFSAFAFEFARFHSSVSAGPGVRTEFWPRTRWTSAARGSVSSLPQGYRGSALPGLEGATHPLDGDALRLLKDEVADLLGE